MATGSGKVPTLKFLGALFNVCQISFLIRALLPDDGNKKKISFIVATNVVASRPPKCRPTGMPTSGANLTRSEGVNNLREVFRKSKNRGIFPNLMVLE